MNRTRRKDGVGGGGFEAIVDVEPAIAGGAINFQCGARELPT